MSPVDSVTVLRFAERPTSSWRNGGGRTREIAAEPPGDRFDWRVSVADVAGDGEFSTFPDVDRVILFCDGPAMALDVDGTEHVLDRHVPFTFRGESATYCRVPGGPTRDLNVMTRRGRCSAEVSVVHAGEQAVELDTRRPTVVVALAGACLARPASAEPISLGAFDALRLDAGNRLWISGAGPVAVIGVAGRAAPGGTLGQS